MNVTRQNARDPVLPALESLPPIERHSLANRVYLDLRGLIMCGRLAPGDRLSLRAVAQAFNVSVMPVRDAVNRLVSEQALLASPNRGFFVPRMTPDEFRELVLIRTEIEGFAVEQAALRRSDNDLQLIASIDQAYRTECLLPQPDYAKAAAANMQFHFSVYSAARLPRLYGIIESLWMRAGPLIILETRSSPERLTTGGSYQRHGEALAAIKAGDGKAAREAIVGDIQTAAASILAGGSLQQDPQ